MSPLYWYLWDKNITQKRGSKLVIKVSEGAVQPDMKASRP